MEKVNKSSHRFRGLTQIKKFKRFATEDTEKKREKEIYLLKNLTICSAASRDK